MNTEHVALAALYYKGTHLIPITGPLGLRLDDFWKCVFDERNDHVHRAVEHAEALLGVRIADLRPGRLRDAHLRDAYLALRQVEYDRLEANAAERRILLLADCIITDDDYAAMRAAT